MISLFLFCVMSLAAKPQENLHVVDSGVIKQGFTTGGDWQTGDGFITCSGENRYLFTDCLAVGAEFEAVIKLSIEQLQDCKAAFAFGPDYFFFCGQDGKSRLSGWNFKAGDLSQTQHKIEAGKAFVFAVQSSKGKITFKINGSVHLSV